MKVTAAGLKKLDNTYKGYLEGKRIEQFFKEFWSKFRRRTLGSG